MVYDVPRNFIGDMHWTGEEDMQEGDEVVLEKAGVRVEVAERIGETETDLSELRAKKGPSSNAGPKRTVENTSLATATPISRASSGGVARGNTQLKQKSLNALLGTPKGQMGKATLPTKSPFEERHADVENEEWADGRPTKKARVAEMRSTKAVKQDAVPLWARTADRRVDQQQQPAAGKVYIDLSDDTTPSKDFLPGFSSDALAPSSPVRGASRGSSGGSSSPARQTRHAPTVADSAPAKHKSRGPRMQELDHGRVNETDVSAHRVQPRKSPEPVRQASPQPSRPSGVKPGQTLRLAASAPKKRMLLCQDQLTKKARATPVIASRATGEEIAEAAEDKGRPKTANERIQERLDLIAKRKARNGDTGDKSTTTVSVAVGGNDEHAAVPSHRNSHRTSPPHRTSGDHPPQKRKVGRNISEGTLKSTTPLSRSESIQSLESPGVDGPAMSEDFGGRSSHEVSAMELARLDRMMLPPAAPRRAPTPPVPIPSPREARPLRRVISEPPNKPNNGNNQTKTASKRVPGAPVRYTPTPSPTKRSREPTPVPLAEKEVRPPTKFKPKTNLQKSVSLNVTAAGTSTVILGRPFQAPGKPQPAEVKTPEPPPEDVGPWSREAFDLFKWRPPGWDEEKWCVVETVEGADKAKTAPAGLSAGASLPSVLKETRKDL